MVGAGLRVGVLGSLVATRDGAPLELGGPRQRGVLALLVLARGDVVPADRMIDALWGDATPPSATSALQAYVSHLRKRMEPDRGPRDRQSVIARHGPGYALRVDEDDVDAWRFERLLRQAGRRGSRRRRSRCWRRRSGCGAARRTPTTPTSRGPTPRWPG